MSLQRFKMLAAGAVIVVFFFIVLPHIFDLRDLIMNLARRIKAH